MATQLIDTTFTYTKKNLFEIQTVVHRKTAKRFRLLMLAGVALLVAGITIIVGQIDFMDIDGGNFIYFGLFWTVFCFVMSNHQARKTARKTVRYNKKHYGTEVCTNIRFYASMLTAENPQSGSKKTVQLGDVVRVIRTKHLYALILPDNIAVMADRRSLDEQTDDALWERLQEKCTTAVFTGR